MDVIGVEKINETFMRISCERCILHEVTEFFTFDVDGAKFSPAYKMGRWDGKIRLVNTYGLIYIGLLEELKSFCKIREYNLSVDESLINPTVTPLEIIQFVNSLNIHSDGKPLQPRDYQVNAIYQSIKERRLTLLSPTSSGKSFIIYCIIRWILKNDSRVLLIVPNIGLVRQMLGDFVDYSSNNDFNAVDAIQTISEGASKVVNSKIVISTWQSIQKEKSDWLNQFDGIIVDEVHLAAANSLRGIMENSTNVGYRIGATGTLSKTKTNKLVIQGLFGKILRVTTTAKLIEQGHISDIAIKCIDIEYQNKEELKLVRAMDYAQEVAYICSHEKRNKMISKLAINAKGNTLVLFNYVDSHGKILFEMIKGELFDSSRKIFFIHGDVKGVIRDDMRALVEKEDNAIIVASYGTMSTGVNIKRIHNIIVASPTKSVIRLLQSIGRGLRKAHDKDIFTWIDIVDDFSGGTKKKNFAFKHFIERLKIYTEEKFNYKIIKIKM